MLCEEGTSEGFPSLASLVPLGWVWYEFEDLVAGLLLHLRRLRAQLEGERWHILQSFFSLVQQLHLHQVIVIPEN